MTERDPKPKEKKKFRLAEKFGGLPVLLLALAGILLLISGGGLFGAGSKKEEAETDPTAYRIALENELAALCSEVKGVGRVSVMITLKEGERTDYAGSKVSSVSPPSVLGAAIVCDGGGDAETRAELTRLVSGLLGIGSNRVTVAERRQ
ncbi:MAG: hypothetical protein J6Z13_04340 [Clostridia bacterium]|nr:hypothetical protein [Clostridia bacterium]